MSFHDLAEPAIYLVVLTMREGLFAINYSTVLRKNVLLWPGASPNQNFERSKNLKNIKISSKVKKHV